MTKTKVAILYGGKSTEHEVSIRSAASIFNAIDKDKHDVKLIYINKNGRFIYHENQEIIPVDESAGHVLSLMPATGFMFNDRVLNIDVVFPVLHGNAGEDGNLQGMLEMLEVAYVGCNTRASSVCMDKDMTKRLLKEAGIQVAPGLVFKSFEKDHVSFDAVKGVLGVPMFVKPVNQGSSVGVTKLSDADDFKKALDTAFSLDTKVMIESGIVGREIEVSVLGNEDLTLSMPGEIVSNIDFYDYESKYVSDDGASLRIPAILTDEEIVKIQDVAARTYRALDCEGLSRVDVFLTESGEVIVNEVNTLPGFTSISMYPKLLEVSGVPYTELITQLIQLAKDRYALNGQLKRSL